MKYKYIFFEDEVSFLKTIGFSTFSLNSSTTSRSFVDAKQAWYSPHTKTPRFSTNSHKALRVFYDPQCTLKESLIRRPYMESVAPVLFRSIKPVAQVSISKYILHLGMRHRENGVTITRSLLRDFSLVLYYS